MATAEQIPGELDITVVQGDDYSVTLTEDVNYSGYTFISTIHELHGTITTCQTTLTSSAASSTIVIVISAAITGGLSVTGDEGSHNWKCVYTDTAGLIRTWVKGKFTVLTGI